MSTVLPSPIRRPLSAGELLDRTITVLANRWVTIVVVVAIAQLPVAIAELFYVKSLPVIATVMRTAAASRVSPFPAVIGVLGGPQSVSGLAAVVGVTALILTPFAIAATAYAVSRAYDGEPATFGAAAAFGLRRTPALIVNAIVLFIAGLFAIAVLFLGVFLFALAVGMLSALGGLHAVRAVAVIIGIVTAVITIATIVVGISLGGLFAGVALVTAAIEVSNPFVAIARSAARMLNRREILRATLLGFALVFVMLVVSLIGQGIATGVLFVTHVSALAAVVTRALAIAIAGFEYGFAVLYYRDIRLRRDGEDVLAAFPQPQPLPI